MSSATFTATYSTSGTYTWTCPQGVSSASWTCAGSSTFNGSGTGSSGSLSAGTGYTVVVSGSSAVVVTWSMASPAEFTANTAGGTFQFTAPSGTSQVIAQCWAAGGGGGSHGSTSGAGAGAGGEYASEPLLGVTAGTQYTFAVGQGGGGSSTSGTAGSAGTNSTMAGDSVTVTAHGGAGGTGNSGGGGAAGGSGSTNTTHYSGGNGGTGQGGATGSGGGGGGSGGTGVAGNAGTAGTSGGAGASAVTGGGPGGNGGGSSTAGSAPSSGPGGGGGGNGGGGSGGGAGDDGQFILTFPAVTSSPLQDIPAIEPGPWWLAYMKPGWPARYPPIPSAPVSIPPVTTSGSMAMAGMAFAASSQVIPSANPSATFTATYTTSGTFTWVAPEGVTSASVQCWAGGGGGGGSNNASDWGCGGGGGEYAAELTNSVTAGDSYTVTVGAAGTAGSSSGGNGGTGGNSTFSGTGATTVTAHGGAGGTGEYDTAGATSGGGAGGSGSSNSAHYSGGTGGGAGGKDDGGGGGAGSGGTGSAGNNGGESTTSTGGAGGTAVTGGGAGGTGGNDNDPGTAPSSGPGGGGGGAGTEGGAGGAGYAGQVVITWTMASPATIAANTSGGTWTWTAPSGTSTVEAQAWGAGGGGGGKGSGGTPAAGGGGGGEYAAEPANTVVAGDSYTFVVGAAGAGGTSGNTGSTGGNSTFSGTSATTVTAHGGAGGTTDLTGGSGGSGSTNTAHNSGGAGGSGNDNSPDLPGGGGGGSGGTASAGNAGGNASSGSSAGAGASAVTGGGPGGNGSATGNGSAPSSGPGGGGGGCYSNTGTPTGGAGYDGQLVLTWAGAATSTDMPAIVPGPTWLATFKPGVPKPLPAAPPFPETPAPTLTSGSLAMAAMALSGSGTEAFEPYDPPLMPGPTWLAMFKQAVPKPLPVSPPDPETLAPTLTSGSLAMAPMAMAGSDTDLAEPFDPPSLMPGPTWLSLFKPGVPKPLPPAPPMPEVPAPALTSGSLAMAGMALAGTDVTVPDNTDTPQIQPGPTWMATFKPGVPKPFPPFPQYVPQPITTSGSLAMAPMALAGTDRDYAEPFDPVSIAPGPAWLALFKQAVPKPPPVMPPDPEVLAPTLTSGSLAMGAMALSGSDMELAEPFDPPAIQPGPAWLAWFKPGRPKPKPPAPPPSITAPPTLTSGSLAMAGMAISGGPVAELMPDVREILPGSQWLRRFKPGMRRPFPQVPDSGSYEGPFTCSGGLAMQPMAFSAAQAYVGYPFPTFILPLAVELNVNGVWTDITSYVLQSANIVITRGQPDEVTQLTSSSMTLTLNNATGDFSPKNPLGAYYGYIGRNTQIRVSAPDNYVEPYTLVYRFWGEVSAWPPSTDETGNYMTVEITASGIWRRFSQNTATIGSPLTRYYTQLTGASTPVGYWPCEDASGATQFASGLPGGDPMQFTGTPDLSTDDSIEGSDPLPDFNGSEWAGTPGSYLTPGSTLYFTPGTYLYTCPGGITTLKAECWGSGGGGAGSFGTDTAGGGGGGGEYAAEASLAVTPGNQYTVVVAAGGAGGVPKADGGAGAASTMAGDSKTVTAHGGGGGGDDSGGTGGTGSTNTTHHNGGHGAASGGGGGGGAFYDSSDTWTCPTGVTSVDVEVQAGGGSGGGSEHYYYGDGAGGGGGGGGGNSGSVGVTAGNDYSVTVGNGGSAVSGEGNGNPGEDSSFQGDDDTVSATGGGAGGQSPGGFGGSGGSPGGSDGSDGGNYDGGDGGDSPNGSGGAGGNTTGAGNAGGAYGGGGGGAGTPQVNPASSGAGAGGSVSLSYDAPTLGAGGGGSGGNTTAGNSATTGAGATAVTDGGPGGDGGSASNGSVPDGGPGGGGGGGDAGTYAGGAGAAGQVLITTTSSTTPTSNVTRFVLNLNAAGETSGTVIVEVDTNGTIAKLTLVYGSGGTLQLIGYNSSGTALFTGSAEPVDADGVPMMVSIELDQDGTAVTWLLQGVKPAATALLFSYTGSVSSATLGSVTEVKPNPGGGLTTTMMGQISVQYASTSLLAMAPILSGYAGELAGDRFLRLCTEEGITALVNSPTNWQFTDGTLDNWTATNGTLTNSAAWSSTYGNSLLLTAAGSAGDWSATSGPALPVSPGDLVSAYCDVDTVASVTGVQVNIAWYNASLSLLSTTSGSTSTVDGQVSIQNILATAPSNSAWAAVTVQSTETVSSGTLLYFTNVRLDRNPMGPQTDATLCDLLQEVPNMDGGFIYEPRTYFGLAYCSLTQAENQAAVVVINYAQAQLAMPLQPTEDDQNTRNYIVLTRGTAAGDFTGSSYTAALTTGALSTQNPPNGVGQYSYQQTVNCYADSQLPGIANQMLSVGTVDEMRYPQINVDLSRYQVQGIFTALTAVDAANFIEIDNASPQMGYGPIYQLALGFTETLNAFVWEIQWNCVPESPYDTG
jgi:hypothetical protein